jgi:hypothetical protein
LSISLAWISVLRLGLFLLLLDAGLSRRFCERLRILTISQHGAEEETGQKKIAEETTS